jgi:hypothetical protein
MLVGVMNGDVPFTPALLVLVAIGYITGSALQSVWVYQDTQKRGVRQDLWLLLVMYFNVAGVLVYLWCRPRGRLAYCPRCRKELLAALKRCPHCDYQPAGMATDPGRSGYSATSAVSQPAG